MRKLGSRHRFKVVMKQGDPIFQDALAHTLRSRMKKLGITSSPRGSA